MTPIEKAINIVDKMYSKASVDEGMGYLEAIECAFVCVDELIKEEQAWLDDAGSSIEGFWKQVKQEIEKL